MSQSPIFYDPRGGRRRALSVGTSVLIGAVIGLAVTFSLTVLAIPSLTSAANSPDHKVHRVLPPTQTAKLTQVELKQKEEMRKALRKEAGQQVKNSRPVSAPGDPICAAFYAPWQSPGSYAFKQNASKITHLIPQWVHLTPDGKDINTTSDFNDSPGSKDEEIIAVARQNGVKIFPVLDNSDQRDFQANTGHTFVNDPDAQNRVAAKLRDWVVAHGFHGINLDFERLGPADQAKLPELVARFVTIFHAKAPQPRVTIDIESETQPAVMGQIAAAADWVVLMAYDQHSAEDKAGPIAAPDWVKDLLTKATKTAGIPTQKLVVGLGNYAYDWQVGNPNAESVSYQDALNIAKDNRGEDAPKDVVDFDEKTFNSHFDYVDENDKSHDVWMLDAVSAFNQIKLDQQFKVRGSALWVLGQEDPSVWTFLGRNLVNTPPRSDLLRQISFPSGEIDYEGDGEILQVKQQNPVVGSRTISDIDPTGFINDFYYKTFPSSTVIKRTGYKAKKLALTFDDGPDGTYTPQILDALKELNVPAAFFVLGTNVEHFPGLVRRMVDEGHEIGNHSFTHPNLGAASPGRVELELNMTQRAIQSVTGRSTTLFRPPYFADAEPQTEEEVRPIKQAALLGYVTVAEYIDPEDWSLEVPQPDGSMLHRTARDFTAEIMSTIKKVESNPGDSVGNIILLHDAGGNRSETVKALKQFVPELEAKGYQFVSVSNLMGVSQDSVMPKVKPEDLFSLNIDRMAFYLVFGGEAFLGVAFLAAIGLGLARLSLVTPLALIYERKRRGDVFLDMPLSVGVMIAAYNEEKVIVRTIQSILASTFPIGEIVVVDDGSKDGTSEIVARAFADEPRVTCTKQENAGKAAALNNAIALAHSEVLVCVDADTQLAPEAIGMLARHFDDPLVGAVAGNVRVGNVVNLLTRWQSLEYTTSQNVDRRAYALLNAITVVPGAIGAWRREAVQKAGGYLTDTLAEDMDLTWRLREHGYVLETESEAIAYTEAPDSIKTFFRQRFRWAYGTLQCLWKHKKSLFQYGWFGWLALPSLWLFQVCFNALAPFVDIQLLYSLYGLGYNWVHRGESEEVQPIAASLQTLEQVAVLYVIFFLLEAFAGYLAYRMDKRSPKDLFWLLFQKFVYRQLMYAVIYKSIVTALSGARQGWGKLDRKATVTLPLADKLRKSHE